MEDELVTFDTAKLAKEKGFDEFTEGYFYPEAFHINNIPRILSDDAIDINKTYYDKLPIGTALCKFKWNSHHINSTFIAVPTQSLLQRWLREKHNLHIIIEPQLINNECYMFSIWQKMLVKNDLELVCVYHKTKGNENSKPLSVGYKNYEEALETALQEGLKLIK